MFGNQATCTIVDMKLQETGTFDTQFVRPYTAEIRSDALENLASRIHDTTKANPGAAINSSLTAGLATSLIMPSTTPERQAAIVNGWNTRRFRFILTVQQDNMFGSEIYYFQGYSEYFDVSHGGHINPNMVFYINSYTRVNRQRDYNNPNGGYIDKVIESRQVANGRYITENTGELYGLRPEDLVIGVQSSYMTNYNDGFGNILDTRIGLGNEVFSTSRNSAIPSNMLSNVITSYRTAQSVADFGQGTENIYDRTIQMLHEPNPMENAFIRELSSVQGKPFASTEFTLNDLAKMDPSVSSRIFYQPVENIGLLSTAGMNSGWSDTTIETKIASIVSQSVPGLMLECNLITAQFFSSNMTIGTTIDTRMLAPGVTVSTANPAACYNMFIMRFNQEVMPDITMLNRIPVTLTVDCDVYNQMVIDVSVDGKPSIRYAVPSFCDALFQPQTSMNRDTFTELVTGVEAIMNYCGIGQEPNTFANAIISV